MSKELIRLQDLTMEFDGERILDGINLYFNDQRIPHTARPLRLRQDHNASDHRRLSDAYFRRR